MFISNLYASLLVLLFFFLLIFFGVGIILVLLNKFSWYSAKSYFQRTDNLDKENKSRYECGFDPYTDSRLTVELHFYLVAFLFLIFDLELIFLIPWISSADYLSYSGNVVAISFFYLLILGLIYEWGKKAALKV